jgi:hypothetical protein
VYVYTIVAKTDAGQITEYDLTDLTGNQRVGVEKFQWVSGSDQAEFYLIEPARVVLRAGLDNHGPLLKTLANWGAFPFGRNTISWNGMDESDVLFMGDSNNIQWAMDAFSLPDNHIFVRNSGKKGFVSNISWPLQVREKKKISKPTSYNPMQQNAEQRGDFPLSLSVLDVLEMDDVGVPVVSGKIRMRLNVDPEHRGSIASQRFEPVFYVDGQFVFENEIGFFPMTFEWNADDYNSGIHYITANLRGDRSNFGMATVKVKVAPQSNHDSTEEPRSNE